MSAIPKQPSKQKWARMSQSEREAWKAEYYAVLKADAAVRRAATTPEEIAFTVLTTATGDGDDEGWDEYAADLLNQYGERYFAALDLAEARLQRAVEIVREQRKAVTA